MCLKDRLNSELETISHFHLCKNASWKARSPSLAEKENSDLLCDLPADCDGPNTWFDLSFGVTHMLARNKCTLHTELECDFPRKQTQISQSLAKPKPSTQQDYYGRQGGTLLHRYCTSTYTD